MIKDATPHLLRTWEINLGRALMYWGRKACESFFFIISFSLLLVVSVPYQLSAGA